MKPQPQLFAVKQLRHPLKTDDTSNRITRFQLRDATWNTRIGFHRDRGINKERQRRIVQQKIKEMPNDIIWMIDNVQEALLMSIEGTDEVFVKGMDLEVELGMVRYIETQAGGIRIVIENAQGRREDAYVMKIDRIVFVAETRNGLAKSIHLEGGDMYVSDFKCLMGNRKYHLPILRHQHLGRSTAIPCWTGVVNNTNYTFPLEANH